MNPGAEPPGPDARGFSRRFSGVPGLDRLRSVSTGKLQLLVIAALVALFCVIGLALLPPDTFFDCDGGSKYILARAFLTHDPGFPALPYPGRSIDPDQEFFPIDEIFALRAGDYVLSAFPIYFPILSAPGLALFGMRGLHLVPILGAALALLFFARIGQSVGWSRRWSLGGIALLALATPFAFYASAFWEHVPALALILAGMAVFFGGGEARTAPRMLAAGLLLGLSAILRPECAWAAAGVAFACFVGRIEGRWHSDPVTPALPGWTGLIALVAGIGAGIAALGSLNHFVYGHAIGPHIFANVIGTSMHRSWLLWRMAAGKISPVWTVPALAALAAGLLPGRWGRWVRLGLAGVLVVPIVPMLAFQSLPPHGLHGLSGILETSPFLFLVSLLRRNTKEDLRGDRHTAFLGRAAAAGAAGVLLTSPVDGGLQGGARFLLPEMAIGLAALLSALSCREAAGASARDLSRRLTRWMAIAFLIVSLPLSLRALPYLVYRGRQVDQPAIDRLRSLPGNAVIFTNSYGPQELAALYWERPFFQITSGRSLTRLATRLGQAGNRGFILVTRPDVDPGPVLPSSGANAVRWVRERDVKVSDYRIGAYAGVR